MHTKIKNLLNLLEKTSDSYWNISKETGFFLNTIIKDRRYKSVFEIGTSNGYSGIWLAEALKETGGHLLTIESHNERFSLAKENFKKAELTKTISQIKGHAPEDLPKNPKSFDMVFFDATKCEHLSYFNALKNRLKRGGMIITDNIVSHQTELKGYIKAVHSSKNFTSFTFNIGTGLLISLKTP